MWQGLQPQHFVWSAEPLWEHQEDAADHVPCYAPPRCKQSLDNKCSACSPLILDFSPWSLASPVWRFNTYCSCAFTNMEFMTLQALAKEREHCFLLIWAIWMKCNGVWQLWFFPLLPWRFPKGYDNPRDSVFLRKGFKHLIKLQKYCSCVSGLCSGIYYVEGLSIKNQLMLLWHLIVFKGSTATAV